MDIIKLKPARGWIWVKQGYQLIMCNPLLAISLALTGTLMIFIALKTPLIGPLLTLLLMPLVLAGYMRVCRALEENETVELVHLFAGFQKQYAARLTALGGFLILGLLISSILIISIGGEPLTTLLDTLKSTDDPQVLVDAMWAAGSSVAISLIIGFALVCVLMLAFQYAPMLVFFNGVPPFAALRASLTGSFRNLIPYTVYNLIMQGIALVLSMLPFNIGLILLLPLGLTSLYVSYRNIFPFADELIPAYSTEI